MLNSSSSVYACVYYRCQCIPGSNMDNYFVADSNEDLEDVLPDHDSEVRKFQVHCMYIISRYKGLITYKPQVIDIKRPAATEESWSILVDLNESINDIANMVLEVIIKH